MTIEELARVVDDEFSCDFHIDDFPPEWTRDEIGRRAAEAVNRLASLVHPRDLGQLERELAAAMSNPEHPLVEVMSNASNVGWADDDAWPILQRLLKLIVGGLRRIEKQAGADVR